MVKKRLVEVLKNRYAGFLTLSTENNRLTRVGEESRAASASVKKGETGKETISTISLQYMVF